MTTFGGHNELITISSVKDHLVTESYGSPTKSGAVVGVLDCLTWDFFERSVMGGGGGGHEGPRS